MAAAPSYLQQVTGELVDIAGDFLRQGGVRVSVKTNFGPELPIYRGDDGQGGGLGSLIGLKAAIIVRSKNGDTLATYGTPPATEPVRVAVLLLVAGLIGVVLFRGVLK